MLEYLLINNEEELPEINHLRPYKAVVVIETEMSAERQMAVSRWLVKSGCLYMMAWGIGCSSWDDSVDYANLEEFGYGDIPKESFVMTIWHDNQPLKDVFWFAKNSAIHPTIELKNMLILHVGEADKGKSFEGQYNNL